MVGYRPGNSRDEFLWPQHGLTHVTGSGTQTVSSPYTIFVRLRGTLCFDQGAAHLCVFIECDRMCLPGTRPELHPVKLVTERRSA